MGFWSFFRRGAPEKRETPPANAEAAPKLSPLTSVGAKPADEPADELARLSRTGQPGGPDATETLATFGTFRLTPSESLAVDALLQASERARLDPRVSVALAVALVDRGELIGATRVLSDVSTTDALMFRADLAERRGDPAAGLALVERVLLRNFDHPGARERHNRFRLALGYETTTRPNSSEVTVVTRRPEAPFDLVREIGRGGAAAVYQAVDRELARTVALKVYHHTERDRDQLRHEGRVAVRLAGPSIVRVFDADPANGWLALEWAARGTMRDALRAPNVLSLLPIRGWGRPLIQALAHVHSLGWVHHDVKPANVLISSENDAILSDFGIARQVGAPSPPGSLGYVSPERLGGRDSHPRDDVFGFGRILEEVIDVAFQNDAPPFEICALAELCTGPDDRRPNDGSALLQAFDKVTR